MTNEYQSKYKLALLAIAVIVLAGGFYYLNRERQGDNSEPGACTMEAKLCPDGSAVGRSGPDCAFAPCPNNNGDGNTNAGWEISNDEANGVTFSYPPALTTKYIDAFDWPPKIEITNEEFKCTEAGSEIERAGATELRQVDSRAYCVTKITEGAAGSIYTQYAYAFARDARTVILTFGLRSVQCGNYDETEMAACEAEREAFDIDGVIDRIVKTMAFDPVAAGNASSGIRGIVRLGPTCPVERIPPDPACADKPYATRLALTTADEAQVIREFESDAQGVFSLAVPSGEYTIRSAAAANILPYCASNQVTVIAGVYTDVIVSCDTGIR